MKSSQPETMESEPAETDEVKPVETEVVETGNEPSEETEPDETEPIETEPVKSEPEEQTGDEEEQPSTEVATPADGSQPEAGESSETPSDPSTELPESTETSPSESAGVASDGLHSSPDYMGASSAHYFSSDPHGDSFVNAVKRDLSEYVPEPVQQYKGQFTNTGLSDNWKDMEIIIDGLYIKLPVQMSLFTENGYRVYHMNPETVQPGERASAELIHTNGINIMVSMKNSTDQPLPASQCEIVELKFNITSFGNTKRTDIPAEDMADYIYTEDNPPDIYIAGGFSWDSDFAKFVKYWNEDRKADVLFRENKGWVQLPRKNTNLIRFSDDQQYTVIEYAATYYKLYGVDMKIDLDRK